MTVNLSVNPIKNLVLVNLYHCQVFGSRYLSGGDILSKVHQIVMAWKESLTVEITQCPSPVQQPPPWCFSVLEEKTM